VVTEKRGGAWMDEVVGQSRLLAAPGEAVRLPVAHMVCNQTPPIGDKPSLMTFRVRSSNSPYAATGEFL
jgi:oligopeptidase A